MICSHVCVAFPFGLDLAAINIQRGRDHGLPAYTQWREPCGLTPIIDWNDLERVVGPKSAERLQHAYKSVDDIDLFVGGLAERPVVGGLVGPVFACIIAQQFSNLRKGDRFWYENDDFESSFTPAQLQSIRQVNFAQIVCRSLGSGTMQPHIFLPHTVSTNERIPCDTGSLTPIDLRPWLEHDPFLKNVQQQFNNSAEIGVNDKIIINLKLRPSSSSPKKKIDIRNRIDEDVFMRNTTTVNNKIDLDTTRSHFDTNEPQTQTILHKPSDKLDMGRKTHTNESTKTKTKTKKPKPNTTTTKTKTTTKKQTTNRRRQPSTKRTKKRKNQNTHIARHKHKRDLTDTNRMEMGRSAIIIKINEDTDDTTATKTPFNEHKDNRRIDKDHKQTQEKKEYVILTPDQKAYDIEIKIKEKKPQTNDKLTIETNNEPNSHYNTYKTTTKQPLQFYQVSQPSISDDGQYSGDSVQHQQPQKPAQPYATYGPIVVVNKRTTTYRPTMKQPTKTKTTVRRPYIYGQQQQQDEPASKPYYTTKRPSSNFGYGSNEPDPLLDEEQPFYNYPTVQNADPTGYYAPTSADEHDDEFISIIQSNKPYQTKPQQYTKPYLDRPSATGPSYANNNNHNYGQFDEEQSNYAQNGRPPTHIQNSDYGPTYIDDFATKTPDKISAAYIVHADDEEQEEEYDDFVQNGYSGFTTNRPHHDLTTYYAVPTTTKKKRPVRTTRRPNRPAQRPIYGASDEDEDASKIDEDDDYDEEDEDDDSETDEIAYFNPTSVFSNLVSTFNGYFGENSGASGVTTTTTRKPYITQDDEDFYTHPSLPAPDFPYSRDRHIEIINDKMTTTTKAKPKRSSRDIKFDFEQYDMTTYRSTYPIHGSDDDDDDNYDDDTYDDTKLEFDRDTNLQYDRDGYLRPEYMNYNGQMSNINIKVHTKRPDMTVWHATATKNATSTFPHRPQQQQQQQDIFDDFYVHHLLNGQFYNTRRHKQLITLTDNDRNNAQSIHNGAATRTKQRPLVPLNVLTKPER